MTPPRRRARTTTRPERTEVLRLPDGRTLWLRPVHPADAGPISGAFELLDEDEVRRRYLHPIKALSPTYLEHLVNPTPGQAFAVVATEPLLPGDALVGAVARITRDHEGDAAEFAILVSHYVTGQGLGKRLMQRLIEWAEVHGVRRIWGDVLDDNTPMIKLVQALGFKRQLLQDSHGLIRVHLDLPSPPRRH